MTWVKSQVFTHAKDVEWPLHVGEEHFDNVCVRTALDLALVISRPKDLFPSLDQTSLHNAPYSTNQFCILKMI